MFQTNGSQMSSISSPPSSHNQSVPHLTHCPSIRCNLSSWNSSTSTDERCARRIPRVCFHTLCDLLYSCEVGLSNISLNSCLSGVWHWDKLHAEPASHCETDQVPGDDLWCKVHLIFYMQVLAV